jgi:outer membrane protein OmpA-like peptidoglycan-associated protein
MKTSLLARPGIRALALALGALWLPAGALAQAPPAPAESSPGSPAAAPHRVGVCECTANPGAPRKFCVTSTQTCEAKCGSPTVSFQVLTRDILKTCPPKELIVNLPFADGRPGAGAVTVTGAKSTKTLDQAYEADEDLEDDDEDAEEDLSEEETENEFHDAFQGRPALPRRFALIFAAGSGEPGAESAAEYQALLEDLKGRKAYEIEITGYADTAANDAPGQKLSSDRANAVAAALVGDGTDQKAISIAPGYGKRVAGGDAEARNRSVEVRVR